MHTLVTLEASMRLDIFAIIPGIGIYCIYNVLVCKVILLLYSPHISSNHLIDIFISNVVPYTYMQVQVVRQRVKVCPLPPDPRC